MNVTKYLYCGCEITRAMPQTSECIISKHVLARLPKVWKGEVLRFPSLQVEQSKDKL
jgi:hypothetical protein